ncbi:Golgi resident protein GCP60-like isoform X2 [Dinothrombium tinctorium]|uniref:Golgi resident protein GCP60-like isoform X2 n=1 Tax=Dinothrombium tinctorium TaxID=1965070 RepID=A0A3S3P4I9_9ACAR|nr:Golgi resident protein GCP60-like isoform X2 [Dinothrombium tinctorium]
MTEQRTDESETKRSVRSGEQCNEKQNEECNFELQWGFALDELFKKAIKFFKDNESKAFHPSYNDRNYLLALVLQVKHGAYNESKEPPLGPFDLVGRDRRQAWSDLGTMSKEEAMSTFIKLLDKLCPLFKPFVEAHKREKDEKERQRLEEEEKQRLEKEKKEQEMMAINASKREEQLKKQAIQEALNRQTYQQFAAYAQQQYPNNKEQQDLLIKQLQEQHYQQYTQQMLQHQLKHQSNRNSVNSGPDSPLLNNSAQGLPSYQSTEKVVEVNSKAAEQNFAANVTDDGENEEDEEPSEEENGSDEEVGPIANAQMWTRKEIKEFKDSIRKDSSDGIIKVGHGEIVTVRVPTHPDGTCIFWEFATDSYDIGFGLLFEWTKNPGSQVSVHISESEDEDEEDDEDDLGTNQSSEPGNDVERGRVVDAKSGEDDDSTSPCSVIIPIYRRDCHEEVFAGSHPYPGKGVYLLKFDNSYSLWRSKTLYYRVYYTR